MRRNRCCLGTIPSRYLDAVTSLTLESLTLANMDSFIDAETSARLHLGEMLKAVAENNETAMAEIYRLTNRKLFGICLRICGDRDAAEEVLHDAYERIWQRAGLWKPGIASPISWLAAIARNRSIDWRRKRGVVKAPLEDARNVADDTIAVDIQVMHRQDLHWCMSRLEMLDERYRDALKDTYLRGMTYLQIALRDNIPLSTVKSRAQRGLRKLQIQFAESENQLMS